MCVSFSVTQRFRTNQGPRITICLLFPIGFLVLSFIESFYLIANWFLHEVSCNAPTAWSRGVQSCNHEYVWVKSHFDNRNISVHTRLVLSRRLYEEVGRIFSPYSFGINTPQLRIITCVSRLGGREKFKVLTSPSIVKACFI